ncbi:MAG: transporter permease [Phycisphaerales bacterium]|nr:transporter permease [Phycisphaerales bacterium]
MLQSPDKLDYAAKRGQSVNRWSAARLLVTIAAGALLWATVAAACLCIGSNGEVGWPADPNVRAFRKEVVLLASLVGASLGAAGVVYQAILRNPLADPYLLGVSSGASLMAYVWRFPFVATMGGSMLAAMSGAMSQQAFAFAGALAAIALVLLLGSRRGRLEPVTVLLVGVIVNAINGSIFLLLNARFPEVTAGAGGAFAFLVGGIQTSLLPVQEKIAALIAGVGWLVLLYLSGQLNVAMLSEGEAQALGTRIQRVRWAGLVVASIVTAAAVAISGPIGFIGLICPHLARMMFGADQRRLLPWSTAFGAALLAAADAVSRLLAGQRFVSTLLPVGVLTALLGAPFFLQLLWQRGRGAEES